MQTASQAYISQMYPQSQGKSSLFPAENPDPSQKNSNKASADTSLTSSSQDVLSLSPAGREIAQKQKNAAVSQEKGTDQKPLTEEEIKRLTDLKQRDTEVKTHEQAHLSAAGVYAAGGASFSYTTGPNGKRYATSGEVPIDMSKEETPAATILKMQTVRRAALAPAKPSSADRAIAARASAKEMQARKTLQAEENNSSKNTAKQSFKAAAEETEIEVSDYSRRRMASAYQTMAALAT